MRRIISKQESEKKEKAKRWIISILLLSIMVLSVFGIIVDSIGFSKNTSGEIKYNGITFTYQQERWFFTKDNQNFVIANSPENLTEINAENLNSIGAYYGKPLYLSLEDKSLESEISYNLYNIVNRMQYGCLNEEKCSGDYPVKTCEENFIILEEADETSITQEQNCVFIKAPKQEMQKALDYFFLKITGIN